MRDPGWFINQAGLMFDVVLINSKQDSVLNHGEPVIGSVDERRMCFDVYNPNDD